MPISRIAVSILALGLAMHLPSPVAAQRFQPGYHTAEPPLADADGDVIQAGAQVPAGRSAVAPSGVPAVAIVIVAPSFLPRGKDIDLKLRVENVSAAAAYDVAAIYPLPAGTRLARAEPQPSAGDVELVWQIGTLAPGGRKEIALKLAAVGEPADLNHTARVRFEHARKATTRLAKPELTLRPTVPKQMQQFDVVTLRLEVVNPGLLEVTDVQVSQTLPDGLVHLSSTDPATQAHKDPQTQTWWIKKLAPNEVRVIDYRVVAHKAGTAQLLAQAVAGDGARADAKSDVAVVAPKLELTATGPGRRAGHQSANYRLTVRNAGSFAMRNVTVSDRLPEGCEFVAATGGAQAFERDVQWILPHLLAGETRVLELTTRCAGSGRMTHQFVAAYRGHRQTAEVETEFESAAALRMNVRGWPEALAVGGLVKYSIAVENAGSAPATHVRLAVTLPEAVSFVSAEPAGHRREGNRVLFDAVTVGPDGRHVVTISAKAGRPDHAAVLTAELTADQLESGALRRQETTVVSGDGRSP
jgi:uncharacterized repeat protein (TIGR01451 family)